MYFCSRIPQFLRYYMIELPASRELFSSFRQHIQIKAASVNETIPASRSGTCYSLRVSRVPLRPTDLLLERICIQFARDRNILLWPGLRKLRGLRRVCNYQNKKNSSLITFCADCHYRRFKLDARWVTVEWRNSADKNSMVKRIR